MLVRILNTLRSRIWDMVLFLFSDYLNLQLARMGDFPERYGFPGNQIPRNWHLYKEFYFFCRYPLLFSYDETVLWLKTIDFWAIPSPFKIKILISIWSQRTEKQKFYIEENMMSEPVKMPVRHFLRSDYLHIIFYIKFLLFVSLAPQINYYLIPHSHHL